MHLGYPKIWFTSCNRELAEQLKPWKARSGADREKLNPFAKIGQWTTWSASRGRRSSGLGSSTFFMLISRLTCCIITESLICRSVHWGIGLEAVGEEILQSAMTWPPEPHAPSFVLGKWWWVTMRRLGIMCASFHLKVVPSTTTLWWTCELWRGMILISAARAMLGGSWLTKGLIDWGRWSNQKQIVVTPIKGGNRLHHELPSGSNTPRAQQGQGEEWREGCAQIKPRSDLKDLINR